MALSWRSYSSFNSHTIWPSHHCVSCSHHIGYMFPFHYLPLVAVIYNSSITTFSSLYIFELLPVVCNSAALIIKQLRPLFTNDFGAISFPASAHFKHINKKSHHSWYIPFSLFRPKLFCLQPFCLTSSFTIFSKSHPLLLLSIAIKELHLLRTLFQTLLQILYFFNNNRFD